jgi:type I restriction-modification system DNA methylase subunit
MSLRLDDPNSTPSGTMQAHLPPTFNIQRKAHKNIRKEIVEKNRLEAVISMPSGVF